MAETALLEVPKTKLELASTNGSDDLDILRIFSIRSQLLQQLPVFKFEAIENSLYVGQASIVYGNGIRLKDGIEKARLPSSNSYLPLEEMDTSTGKFYDLREEKFSNLPLFDKNVTYIQLAEFYKIDREIIRKNKEAWERYNASRRQGGRFN